VVVIDEDAELSVAGVDRPAPSSDPRQPGEEIGATLHDDDEGQKRRWRLFRKGGE
jgi:hypothetical protein